MSTSVGDPFLLSSYSVPHIPTSYANGSSKLANVYATHQNGLSTDGHVVTAAQGDGVHVLDLSTLHPVVSHTLGPSTVFTCPAVSRINVSGENSQSSVYAVMENVQGMNPDERGRTVRVWIDSTSGEGSSSSVKQRMYSAVLPHRVANIVVHDELPDSLLFIGPNGELTITDGEVNIQHTYSPTGGNTRLIRSFAFGRKSSFVPNRSTFKQGVVVVTLVNLGLEVHLVVLGASPSTAIVLGDCSLPISGPDIVNVSCSQYGFISVLTRSGEWHALQIDSPDYTTISLTKPCPSISLRSLTFTASTSAGMSPDEISILSLGSSHVLLAGVTSGSSSELALLLWDLQYGVLLASRTLAIPSSLNRSKKHGIDIQLVKAIGRTQQALLVLGAKPAVGTANGSSSHQDRPSNDTTQRSTILVVPYTVPVLSTIANVLGRAAVGEKWLSKIAPTAKPLSSNLDSQQDRCIKDMRIGLEQKRVEAADEAFLAWVSQVDIKAATSSKSTSPKIPYSHEFVKQVLEIILYNPKGSTNELLYSPKVVRHLLEKRCVSSNMIPGGLLPALRIRKDWLSMILAVKTVNDIPEDHLVSFLSATVTPRQREKLPLKDDSAMEVDDNPSDSLRPPLSTVLPLCVTYPISPPALRLALRTQLSDAEALTSVLGVLAEWMQSYSDEEPQLLPQATKKDLHGALVPLYQEKKKRKDRLPPLEKILLFIQTILDSSFISLLSYPPSFNTLRQIFSYIEPETTYTDDLEPLRGPLEPFVKAHKKMVHEAAHGPEKPDPNVDWRKKRKEAHEQAAISVGVYQVEELVL